MPERSASESLQTSFNEDIPFDFDDTKSHLSRASKKHFDRSGRLRRASIVSKNEQKRVGTAMSRTSRLSRGSGGSFSSSGGGLGSVKRSLSSLFQHYMRPRDEEEEDKEQNPFDAVFGKRVVKRIKDKSSSYIEKLNYLEFRDKVEWENSLRLPEFIIDLINGIAGFNLHEYLQVKQMRDQEERD